MGCDIACVKVLCGFVETSDKGTGNRVSTSSLLGLVGVKQW